MLYITDDPAWIDAITEADAEAKAEAEYEAARAAYHATKAPAKQRFYVTYGCGTRLANSYSIVEAKDYATARKHVFEVCGRQWAFIYSDDDNFQRTIDHYLLELVPLQPQGEI